MNEELMLHESIINSSISTLGTNSNYEINITDITLSNSQIETIIDVSKNILISDEVEDRIIVNIISKRINLSSSNSKLLVKEII